jgi:heme-degrading monooxygenase HmoA
MKGGRMIVVVFRARLKPGTEKEIEETDSRMAKLAAAMPGFVSYSQYMSGDGEQLAVVEFESHETAAAWRAHPEHREAQRLGRERWFTEYRITVCDAVRDYSFKV